MCCNFRPLRLILALLALGGLGWLLYESLDGNQKRFVKNLVRQAPELPGRYQI